MSHQLWYTSAEKGLSAGSRGFCTVKATRGIPQPLAQRLESLSAYTHLFSPQEKGNPSNPVAYHYIQLRYGGRIWYVLSRVCDAGLDYSGRTNKFAHHIVLDRDELPPGGPAWLMSRPGLFDEAWDGVVGVVDGRKSIPRQDCSPRPCMQWHEAAGDAGWAGVLAESALNPSGPPVHIIVPLQVSVLPLLEEALALLPPDLRWSAPFSTYYTEQFPADVSVRWRVVIEGTREATRAAAIRHQPVINLTEPGPVPAQLHTQGVEAARSGTLLRPAVATAAPAKQPVPAPLSNEDEAWDMHPTIRPISAAPPPGARAASRPPDLGPTTPPIVVPRHHPTYSTNHRTILKGVLISALPLILFGLVLGVSVQRLNLLSKLAKTVSMVPAGDKQNTSSDGAEQKENKSQEQRENDSGDRGQGSPKSEDGGSKSDSGRQDQKTADHGSPTTPEPTTAGNQSPERKPESLDTPSRSEPSQTESKKEDDHAAGDSGDSASTPPKKAVDPSPKALDATKPKWHVREIPHGLSKWIKLGVIEEVHNGEEVQDGAMDTSKDSFHYLIDRDRLIFVARPELETQFQRVQMEAAESAIPFSLRFTLHVPEWAMPRDPNEATTEVKLTINKIGLTISFSKDGKEGSAEYELEAPREIPYTSDKSNRLTFKLKPNDSQDTSHPGTAMPGVESFDCNIKFREGYDIKRKEGERSAFIIEMIDPKIGGSGPSVRKMEVLHMEGRLEVDIVPEELGGTRIRVFDQKWTYNK